MALSAEDYRGDAAASFMCMGGRHDRCRGVWISGSADGEWARKPCACACHRGPETDERPFYGPAAPATLGRPRPVMSAADSMAIGDWLDDHNVPRDAR